MIDNEDADQAMQPDIISETASTDEPDHNSSEIEVCTREAVPEPAADDSGTIEEINAAEDINHHDISSSTPQQELDLKIALPPIIEKLAILRDIKNNVAYNRNKDDLIARLDKQVQDFTRRKDPELLILKPLFLGMIRVIDALDDQLRFLEKLDRPQTIDQTRNFINSIAVELRDLLLDRGVEEYTVKEQETLNHKHHQIIDTSPSEDSANYQLIKCQIRPGYIHRNEEMETVIRQAKVNAYKAPKPIASDISSSQI